MKPCDKIPGGILPYALAICLVMSLLCSGAILITYYKNLLYTSLSTSEVLRNNVTSGFQYALVKGNEIPVYETYPLDLFGGGNDSIYIIKSFWGVYPKYEIKAARNNQIKKLIALTGVKSFPYSEAAIYLANLSDGLTVVGNTHIEGNVYLPTNGVRPGYIASIGYSSKQLIFGTVSESTPHLPTLDIPFLQEIPSLNSAFEDYYTKLANARQLEITHYSTRVIIGRSDYFIIREELSGNIIVISQQQIDIGSDSKLNGVILCAPRIKVEEGFEGNVQLFATDTVVIEPRVKLNFPSAIVLDSPAGEGLIDIGSTSFVQGLVCSLNGDINIQEHAEIMGAVYSGSNVQLNGKVIGHVTCKSFKEKNTSGIYMNHILNAVINRSELSSSFIFAPIGENKKQEILKWLN